MNYFCVATAIDTGFGFAEMHARRTMVSEQDYGLEIKACFSLKPLFSAHSSKCDVFKTTLIRKGVLTI